MSRAAQAAQEINRSGAERTLCANLRNFSRFILRGVQMPDMVRLTWPTGGD